MVLRTLALKSYNESAGLSDRHPRGGERESGQGVPGTPPSVARTHQRASAEADGVEFGRGGGVGSRGNYCLRVSSRS